MWIPKVYRNIDSTEASNRRGGLVLRKVVYEWWYHDKTGEDRMYYRGRMWMWFPRSKRAQRRLERKLNRAWDQAAMFQLVEEQMSER